MKLEGPIWRHLKALVTVESRDWAEAEPASTTPVATAASKRDRCIRFLLDGRGGSPRVEWEPGGGEKIAIREGGGECWGERLGARTAERRELPNGANCRTARTPERRELPNP